MTSTDVINFSCLEVDQPIGTFYVGVIDAPDLVEISWADVRRLEVDERELETYLGIQRPLVRARVAELKEYVRNVDATFPTSVLLAVSSEDAIYFPDEHRMEILRQPYVAKIIDGQHRIAGLEGLDRTFQSIVTIFIDMDIEDQANVFATINLKQTKVNRSLAYDLLEFAKTRSPQKTAHNIARLLDSEPGSPLESRIKALGVATPGRRDETLTQALVVDRLLALMSTNPMRDRDELKRGRKLRQLEGDEWTGLPFRNLLIDERDQIIARNMWNFFPLSRCVGLSHGRPLKRATF